MFALALFAAGAGLLAPDANATPSLPCLVGHSYYSGCLVCEPPQANDYCACAPECAPQASVFGPMPRLPATPAVAPPSVCLSYWYCLPHCLNPQGYCDCEPECAPMADPEVGVPSTATLLA